jgi:hypothetical protein
VALDVSSMKEIGAGKEKPDEGNEMLQELYEKL